MNLLTAAVITAGAIGCTAADRTSASVTERGIGPLGVGMTVAQARGVLPGFSVPTDKGCEYARGAGLPAGVGVMVEDGIVVRFDVDSGTVPTAAGVRVGDPALRIRFVYGARVTSAPNKYTSEQDFTFGLPTPVIRHTSSFLKHSRTRSYATALANGRRSGTSNAAADWKNASGHENPVWACDRGGRPSRLRRDIGVRRRALLRADKYCRSAERDDLRRKALRHEVVRQSLVDWHSNRHRSSNRLGG